MRDFSLTAYSHFLKVLNAEYLFATFRGIFQDNLDKFVVLRHDVDRKPEKALRMAKIEADFGIRSTYFFRVTDESFDPKIIQEIAFLGHEIGYHYENLSTAARRLGISRGDLNSINLRYQPLLKAIFESETKNLVHALSAPNEDSMFASLLEAGINDFENNLQRFRSIVPIATIAMHGMPLLPIDNRLLWTKFDYRKYDIVAEPYFDVNYNEVLYITDAGRTWCDSEANQRDKVCSKFLYTFTGVREIEAAVQKQTLPSKLLINVHPEHWTDTAIEWYWIYLVRKIKNTIKRCVL